MYNLIHTGHLCEALRSAGTATWNVEYRSRGDAGSSWQATRDDVARAVEFVDTLVARHRLERERVVLVGHSAGGQLGLWAAKRFHLPVVALAAVSDLRESASRHGREGDVARFLGGMPDELPERYAEASPRELLPLGVSQTLVHGTADPDVPYEMSAAYARAAGEEARLITLEGAGHFEPIDPASREWPIVADAIATGLALAGGSGGVDE
jgi:pimeloyl-ACP methyl ester carboxylesterase